MLKKYIKEYFSKEVFRNVMVEGVVFVGCTFNKCRFKEVVEKGNEFIDCEFTNCTIENSYIGYNQSSFENCSFIENKIKKTSFICPIFKRTKFYGTFSNIDFNASAFDNCVFEGQLKDVWFKGGFQSKAIAKRLGPSMPNKMLKVDFSKSTLNHTTFSNNCLLDTVLIPNDAKYLKVDKWNDFIACLESNKKNAKDNILTHLELFLNVYKVHASTQDQYILNTDDIIELFDSEFSVFLKDIFEEWTWKSQV